MENLSAIILAAGEGKRMKSNKSKVLHTVCGKAMVEWVFNSVQQAGIHHCVIVVGYKADEVMEYMGPKVQYALQKEQLGTGHAVMQAIPFLRNRDGYVIVLNGDAPLIQGDTIRKAFNFHIDSKNAATVLTTELEDPTGYGRIVRDKNNNVMKIVEHKDADEKERMIKEVNSGVYCFTIPYLIDSLGKLDNKNAQGEYYLTDTIEILIREGHKVGAMKVDDSAQLEGVNDRTQLLKVEEEMKRRIMCNQGGSANDNSR
ncbi:MAG: NTP transferase domain-containing protein [Clostridiaceae bacterium]|nr:NTP transferase domain-containing protein [Clostridiaceae bacterium]